MTLHAYVEYKCKSCGTDFIPLPLAQRCPKCAHKASKVFESFVEDSIRSALYNVSTYGSLIPPGWGFFTVGDSYYWLAFQFLSFVSSSLGVPQRDVFGQGVSEETARKLASTFIDKLHFGKRGYMANAFEIYFTRLLCSPKTDQVKDRIEPKVFLSHSIGDKEFCDKLYSDLVASGIRCWYFPEDATFGSKIWDEISKPIHSCDRVIVVCSKKIFAKPSSFA